MRNRAALRLYGVLSVIVACATPAAAQFRPRPTAEAPLSERYRIEGTAGLWNPTPTILVTSESLGIVGSEIDFIGDLGLQKKRLGDLGVTFHPSLKHKIRFEYVPLVYAQDATLRRDVVFNGQRYRAGLPVSSKINWKAYRFTYEYDFITQSRGFGGIVVDARLTDIEASLRTSTLNEFTKLRALIPTIGGIARIYVIPEVSITGELTGIKVPQRDLYDFNGHYVDLSIYGTVNLTPNIGAQFGYRSFDVEAEISQDAGTFTLKGLYVGVVARY